MSVCVAESPDYEVGYVPLRKPEKTDRFQPKEDCISYVEKKCNCRALNDLYCVTTGVCRFYKSKDAVEIKPTKTDEKISGLNDLYQMIMPWGSPFGV